MTHSPGPAGPAVGPRPGRGRRSGRGGRGRGRGRAKQRHRQRGAQGRAGDRKPRASRPPPHLANGIGRADDSAQAAQIDWLAVRAGIVSGLADGLADGLEPVDSV